MQNNSATYMLHVVISIILICVTRLIALLKIGNYHASSNASFWGTFRAKIWVSCTSLESFFPDLLVGMVKCG